MFGYPIGPKPSARPLTILIAAEAALRTVEGNPIAFLEMDDVELDAAEVSLSESIDVATAMLVHLRGRGE